MAESDMERIFGYIDDHQDLYVQRLADSVAIQSVSAWPENRQLVRDAITNAGDEIVKLGGSYELDEPEPPEGETLELPPILFGVLGNDPAKKTVLVYGHLDVQPAKESDGWDSDPFVLTESPDGKLYGRGSTDDKGPVLCGLNALEAYKELDIDYPVNVKFVYEGMEESGYGGIDEALEERKDTWLKGVDFVMISDNYWLGQTTPCLTYGLRGVCYFLVEIECAGSDLHSGVHGGVVFEAMNDLIALMASLTDAKGNILIAGINEAVAELTPEEESLYEPIDFDVDVYKQELGVTQLTKDTKEEVLMNRWRYPSLSLHGIEGAFADSGTKTVIPQKVIGKFSIRLVPDMHPVAVETQVKAHLNQVHTDRGSPNPLKITLNNGSKPWVTNFNDEQFEAGKRAVFSVFNKQPDMTREGGSIPVTLALQDTTGASVMLLPVGSSDDGAHAQNEKINRTNYIEGTKLLASYFNEIANPPSTTKLEKAGSHQKTKC